MLNLSERTVRFTNIKRATPCCRIAGFSITLNMATPSFRSVAVPEIAGLYAAGRIRSQFGKAGEVGKLSLPVLH